MHPPPSSQLVATDYHFQAIYDVAMIQVLIFNLYVLIRDSYKAGRYLITYRVPHYFTPLDHAIHP